MGDTAKALGVGIDTMIRLQYEKQVDSSISERTVTRDIALKR